MLLWVEDQEANFSICVLFEKRQGGWSREERAYSRHWNAEKVVSLGIGRAVGRETKKMARRSGLRGMGQGWQGEME